MFVFQFLIQAGLFFTIPLYLSVALGLSAIGTGIKMIPLSVTLLIAAVGIPRFFPHISPRLVVQGGLLAMFAGIVWLFASIDAHAGRDRDGSAAGRGPGDRRSGLAAGQRDGLRGPDDESPAVGGLQNTATNLGASIGTALAGSLLIAALTASFLHGIEQNPAVPAAVSAQASTELAGGTPFLADADLQTALTNAGASKQVTQAVLDENQQARLDGLRTALAAPALLALIALFFSARIPAEQPGSAKRRPEMDPDVATTAQTPD
jgi:hypothetical protein